MTHHDQHHEREGTESQPGKVWQDSDTSGQGQGGAQSEHGGRGQGGQPTGQGGMRGAYDETRAERDVESGTEGIEGNKDERPENEPLEDSQWQGSRFSAGGSAGTTNR